MAVSEKRQEILNAALLAIAEHGFHEAPIAQIADRAGVGAGTIYRYFATKDELIREVFLGLHARISGELAQGYDAARPLRERFLHLGTALLRYFIASPPEFRFLEQFFNSPYGIEFRRDCFLQQENDGDLYRRLLVEGKRQGVVKNLPMEILKSLGIGPMLAVARDHISGLVRVDDELIVRIVEGCWDGIKKEDSGLIEAV